MNNYVGPMLAGLLLAGISGAASAQTTPATRACMPGEQLVGGVCRPLTGTPDRPSTNNLQQPDSTGSTTGGPSTGNQNTGGSGGQGGSSSGGPSTGNQNTGGSGGQGGGSGGSGGGTSGSGG